jgi:hypothetical protein
MEKGTIIIAVKRDEEQIIKQLKNLKNNNLKWITINEIIKETVLENRSANGVL